MILKHQVKQYSRLKYEQISHLKQNYPRIWTLEKPLTVKAIFFSPALKFIKRFLRLKGKQEVSIGVIMLIGLIPHTDKIYAAPPVHITPPLYIAKIPKQAKVPVSVIQPPQTLDPIVEPQPPAPPPITPIQPPNYSQTVPNCGDNQYAYFIYMHESGCNLYNPNSSSGACGLGQAYPCSKLMQACPSMDYACENAFFNAYSAKYGGWAGSYAFWVANNWW